MTFQTLNARGEALLNEGKFEAAAESYMRALQIAKVNKTMPTPALLKTLGLLYHLIAHCHYKSRKYLVALEYYQAGLKLTQSEALRYEMALCQLHAGDYVSGLKNYDARYYKDTDDAVKFPDLPIPFVETVEGIAGKHLLVLNEQGFGDELMFLRYVEDIAKTVETAWIQVYPEMRKLVELNLRFDNVKFFSMRSFNIDFVNQFNAYTSLGAMWAEFMSLGVTRKLKFENIIVPPPKTKTMKIGIVCSANGKSINAADRSVDCQRIIDMIDELPQSIAIYNLNPDKKVQGAIDFEDIKDFYDTALIIKSMDLVLSVDTAVAHLTMAVGTPLILMHRDYIDWRWDGVSYGGQMDINVSEDLTELRQAIINKYLRGDIWNFH